MKRCDVEIGMRDIGSESGAGDANRQRSLNPRLGRIAFLTRIASNPFYGTQPAEPCPQQIADREVLDLALPFGRFNLRAFEEAVGATHSGRAGQRCGLGQDHGPQNSAHSHDVSARPARGLAGIFQISCQNRGSLISPKFKGDYFVAIVNSFPKKEATFPWGKVYGRRPAAAPWRPAAQTCRSPPVHSEATGQASRRRPSTGGSSQRPLNVDSRPSVARREPALGVVPVLAARWRP